MVGKRAWPATKGLGPQNPTKKLAHSGVLLGHLVSQNRDPKLSDLFFRYSILYLMRFQKVCLTVSVCLCVSVCIYLCVYMCEYMV